MRCGRRRERSVHHRWKRGVSLQCVSEEYVQGDERVFALFGLRVKFAAVGLDERLMRELRRRAVLVLRRSELHESVLLRPSVLKRLCVPNFILRCWPVFISVEQLFVVRRLSFWALFSAIKRCLCNVLPSWVLREWCAVRELSTGHIHKRQQYFDCVHKLCGRQLPGVDIGIRVHSLSDGNIHNCCWSC